MVVFLDMKCDFHFYVGCQVDDSADRSTSPPPSALPAWLLAGGIAPAPSGRKYFSRSQSYCKVDIRDV